MRKRAHISSSYAYYLMVIPIMLIFIGFHTFPFLKGIFYSLTDWKGYGEWNFTGLQNYVQLLKDSQVGQVYKFTLLFSAGATVLVNVLSLFLACALNAKIKFKTTLKAIYFLPYMLGILIIGFVFNYIFANILPEAGKAMGIQALSVNLLGTEYAWIGLLFVTVWQSAAFNTMIYLSGLQTVDRDLYEAAAIDGCGGVQRFFRLTFPLIAPFFTINMVLSGKNFLMAFDQVMSMTDGGPGILTTTISVMIYKRGFTGGQFSYQSANAVVLFLVIAAISLFQMKVLERREAKYQ